MLPGHARSPFLSDRQQTVSGDDLLVADIPHARKKPLPAATATSSPHRHLIDVAARDPPLAPPTPLFGVLAGRTLGIRFRIYPRARVGFGPIECAASRAPMYEYAVGGRSCYRSR